MEPITIKLVCLEPGDRSVGINPGEFTVEVKIVDGGSDWQDPEQVGYLVADLKKLFTNYLDNGTVLTEAERNAQLDEEEKAYKIMAEDNW